MIEIIKEGAYLKDGLIAERAEAGGLPDKAAAKTGTVTYSILQAHNQGSDMRELRLRFDALASHDITYVGIIQTARASGLEEFPMPYVLTNCHNSLCAVGGTINEDDHLFGLSAAKKYGGEFVPAHQAVIHQYMRERYAGSGKMILASDSHTRYGAYGTLAIGEGGPELSKQLLNKTYDILYPDVIGVYLTGKPAPGVGPQDVALALIKAVFESGFVKNKVMEFIGPGIGSLSMDYRNGIDVMTTETTCLSSVWQTDEIVRKSLREHGRPGDYKPLEPAAVAWYDGIIKLNLSRIEPMIAMPFHPSNAYTIREFKDNKEDILHAVDRDAAEKLELKNKPESLLGKLRDGKFMVDQGVIGGCSGGTYQNLVRAGEILKGHGTGAGAFWLSVYPASQPVMLELTRTGILSTMLEAGVSVRSAFCGPCFGAGDVPANGGFSIRHSTRNFPNREGSKPSNGQISYVGLMDARSIAATAINGGALTAATELEDIAADSPHEAYKYDASPYKARVYMGSGIAQKTEELVFGPNIADWPAQIPLPEDLLLTVAAAIYDPVTTTDELIPSGETSSYRSNPLKLAEFTLSRKDPEYVGRAKAVAELERLRRDGLESGRMDSRVTDALKGCVPGKTGLGSIVMAVKPGDGSAREQAASCQRVLGGAANICGEYATKRYRSNVVNWGMLPFITDNIEKLGIAPGDLLYIPGIRRLLKGDGDSIEAVLTQNGLKRDITLKLPGLTRDERDIILAGCLINYYAK